MKKLILSLSIIGVLFSGCSGEIPEEVTITTKTDTNDTVVTDSVDTLKVEDVPSNIGNNINGLGYYGDGVKFGDFNITDGIWNIIDIKTNDIVQMKWYKDDKMTLILKDGTISEVGIYGVNEYGTSLIEDWSLINRSLKYVFIDYIIMNDNKCLRVETGDDKAVYAMCNYTNN